jgi:aryl-alcohol dehydrogenase-like predicted oxidoreductase
VLSVAPQLRGVARKQAATQFNPGQFSLETLKSSFETSLRELKTGYVDFLLMHGPPLSALHQDDLLEAMGRLLEQGKVRVAGASVEGEVVTAVLSKPPAPLTSAQFALNPFSIGLTAQTGPASASLLLIANHPFGGAEGIARCRMEIDRMRQDPALPQSLREKLDSRDETLLPELVLNCIISGTGVSIVIPSMLQPKHLKTNVQAVQNCRFSPAELQLVRESLSQSTIKPADSPLPTQRKI